MSDTIVDSAWITQVLRRHLENNGRPTVDVIVQPFRGGGGFASELYEALTQDTSLVVKLLPRTPRGTYRNLQQQYLNERHFYEEVLFLLASAAGASSIVEELFPTFFCAYQDDFQDLIATEDLRPLGFSHASGPLDETHVRLALRELGRFHALSYIAKKNDGASFLKVVNSVRQPRTEEICNEISPMIKDFLGFATECFRRFYPADSGKFSGNLEGLADLADVFGKLTEPEEPLAVCCHGDFHRNNILFKYDDDGKPTSARFVDFQLKTYSSPAVDVSLVMFLSSSPEVWELSWDELLGVYRCSMLDTMAGILGRPREVLEVDHPVERLQEDFRRYCVHGFLVAIFFLPVAMLEPRHYELVRQQVPGDVTTPDNSKKFTSLVRRYCSEQVKDRLATLLKLMMERDFI